jgi:hypothetical protein
MFAPTAGIIEHQFASAMAETVIGVSFHIPT